MARKAKKKQVLMTGIRRGGESDFEFTINGNPASRFPPLILKMTLHEMQQWLHQTRQAPPESGKGEGAHLRLVG